MQTSDKAPGFPRPFADGRLVFKSIETPSINEFLSTAWTLLLRTLLGLLLATGLAAALPAVAHASGAESPLPEIRARGVVRIGVKTDFAPFGTLDQNGHPVGFEVDLARRIAQTIGVRLQAVPVSTENRSQSLDQGLIVDLIVDLIVAIAGDTRDRRSDRWPLDPALAADVPADVRPRKLPGRRHRREGVAAGDGMSDGRPEQPPIEQYFPLNVRDELLTLLTLVRHR